MLEWFLNFFITSGRAVKNRNMLNKELDEKLSKPIIRKFEERKVNSPFIENIWDADLADIQLISKSNKGIYFFQCVTDIFSK